MPIQFQCEKCGHALSVSSKLAGKSGKCPQCQAKLLVPTVRGDSSVAKNGTRSGEGQVAASPQQPVAKAGRSARPSAGGKSAGGPASVEKAPAKTAAAKTAAAKGGAAALDAARMGALLDQMGFVKKTGPTCPSCGADVRPGTVVCTSCGYNSQTEKKIVGYDAKIERPEFDNLYLQQAVENMQRDTLTDQRREKSSMPWWVLASFLIGLAALCGAGVILVDANFGEPAPADTRLGRIQRVPVLVILGSTVGLTGLALTLFAHLNICTFGFQRKFIHGAACFFLPLLYSVPYGISNWTDNKAPIKGLMMALIFVGIGTGLIIWGGGFEKLNGVL